MSVSVGKSVRMELEWVDERDRTHRFRADQLYASEELARASLPDWLDLLGIREADTAISFFYVVSGEP